MMAAALKRDSLIDRLPSVRGTYEEGVPLANLTWFRVGGPAEVLFRPADEDDLVVDPTRAPYAARLIENAAPPAATPAITNLPYRLDVST